MIISTAYAQASGSGGAGGGIMEMVLMMAAIFGVFYFLMIRPQQKRVRTHRALVDGLRRGDRVITSGGLAGVVTRLLEPPFVQVEITEGVRIRVVREHIQQIVNPGSESTPTAKVEKPASGKASGDNKKANP